MTVNPLDFPWWGYHEPSRTVQVPHFPHAHEVRVWLPPSYHASDRTYPTVWATDGMLDNVQAAVQSSVPGLEAIIVSIGPPRDTSALDWITRRELDFTPGPEYFVRDHQIFKQMGSVGLGGADLLRDFLIDELRPQLARQYRMDLNDNCLVGISLGGVFSTYSLLTRPEAYSRYLLGTTGFWGLDYRRLESELAQKHDDLPVRLYVAAGGGELTMENWPLVSGMADFVERLVARKYPSLKLTTELLGNYVHGNVIVPIMVNGMLALFEDKRVDVPVGDRLKALADAGWARAGSAPPWTPPQS